VLLRATPPRSAHCPAFEQSASNPASRRGARRRPPEPVDQLSVAVARARCCAAGPHHAAEEAGPPGPGGRWRSRWWKRRAAVAGAEEAVPVLRPVSASLSRLLRFVLGFAAVKNGILDLQGDQGVQAPAGARGQLRAVRSGPAGGCARLRRRPGKLIIRPIQHSGIVA
jgi:hypothetical protein